MKRQSRKELMVVTNRTSLAPSMRQFEEICTADELLPLARAYASENKGYRKMAALLQTENFQSMSFGKLIDLLMESGVAFTELALTYQNFQHAKAGIIRSYHMPNIMKDLTEDAMHGTRTCPKCKGRGKVGEEVCQRCNGSGKIDRMANRYARKMVLESAGLIGQSKPLIVNNTAATFQLPSMEEAMIGAAKVIQHKTIEVTNENPALPPAQDGEATGADSERS